MSVEARKTAENFPNENMLKKITELTGGGDAGFNNFMFHTK